MKGRNKFTSLEILTIKKLIAEKVIATRDKQKSIRAKIRRIGFHYSDFSSKKDGYTVEDFENLIRSGQIEIADGVYQSSKTYARKDSEQEKSTPPKSSNPIKHSDLLSTLNNFKINRFDPKSDYEKAIANTPGNYILCLRKNAKLPSTSIKPVLTSFESLQVIYTGISSDSLRKRDYRQHFKGNNAGRSTLRKSLGVLFGYLQIPRDTDPKNGKKKFNREDELKLSEWMCENLVMYFLPTTDFCQIEQDLINHFNPPLNLKNNDNAINREFRTLLTSLRAKKIEDKSNINLIPKTV